MKHYIRTKIFLVFLLMMILNISCEKPTGDFVVNSIDHWSEVLVVPLQSETDRRKLEIIKNAFMEGESVVKVTALSEIPINSRSNVSVVLTSKGVTKHEGTEAHIYLIDYGFLEVLGLRLFEGRDFYKGFSYDSKAFLINENLSGKLENQSEKGYNFSAIGQELSFNYKSQKYQGQIIGVIEDYRIHFDDGTFAESVPIIFKISAKELRYVAIRTKDISATTSLLQKKWNELGLTTPFEVFLLSDRVPNLMTIIEKNKIIKLYIIDSILFLTILIIIGGLIINRQGAIGHLFQMSGRINRGKYFFLLFMTNIVSYILIFFVIDTILTASVLYLIHGVSGLLFFISFLVILIIQIFLVVKRLHDLERQGSNFWLLLIPFYNIYLIFVLYFTRGTVGANKYGEDPISISYIKR